MTDGTIIKPCTCKHDWQDAKYGKGNRVHNFAAGVNKPAGAWRCTVCGKETQASKVEG